MRPLADRTLQMREASYDVLLEWMANSTVARSNANASERIRMEDPTAWLKWKPQPKSRMVRRCRQGGGSQAHRGQPAQSGCPAVPDQDALCYRRRPGTDRGVIVVCDGAGVVGAVAGWMLTSEPQRGEHANETWFITQEGAIYRRCVSAEIIGVQRVMVGAEGMMGLTLKQPGNVRYAPYFDGALSWLESNHSPGKASGRCRTLLLGNQVRLLTDDDVTMIQATLLHTATETEDQPQKDRSHHGKEAEYSTGSTA